MADDKKYEVEPSGENIRTIFDYHGDISSFIDWAEEKSMTVKKLEDEYQDVLDSVKVYSAGKVKFVAAEHGDYYRVLLIRTSKDDTTVDDYLERGKFAQINHGEKEFTIRAFDVIPGYYVNTPQKKYSKRTKIIAKGEIYDSAKYEEELMPDSNYKFYHDKKLVATMFLDFYNSEMTDVNPTINSFDVEEGGEEYKKTIIHGVEEMLGKQGFKKIWITNYIGYPPPSDFWRKMGYKFDIDEGCKSLKKYQLKPLPKWTDKLCSEIVEIKDIEKQIKLLERLPENDQIRLLKASTLYGLGEYEEAIECCDRTVEQFPYSRRFDQGVQSVKAEALEKLGRHEEALKCWDKNIKHFEKAFKNDEIFVWEFTNSIYEKANVLEKIGRYDESIKLYEKLVEIEKADKNYSDQYGSDHWWWSYVNKLNGLGRHEEALKVCDDVMGYDPTDEAIWELKVGTLEKLGRYEEALKCWDKVIEIEVKNGNDYTYYYAAKAKILNLLGRHEEALKCVDEAKASEGIGDPIETYDLFFQKSEALDRLARYEEAIECLDEMIKSFNYDSPGYGRVENVWKRKAKLFRDSERYEEYKKCREEMKKLPTAEQRGY